MIRVAENSESETELVWVSASGDDTSRTEVARRDLPSRGSTVVAVVEALREADAVPPEPNWTLDDVVDTESLDRLFADKASGDSRAGGVLAFDAWGVTVVVTPDAVRVFRDDDDPSPEPPR